jgi:hypothetical protein
LAKSPILAKGTFSSRNILAGHFLRWRLGSGVDRRLELPP